jgi:hypothetical protein
VQDLWAYHRSDRTFHLLQETQAQGGRTYASLLFASSLDWAAASGPALILFAGANCRGRCICFNDVAVFPLAPAFGKEEQRWHTLDVPGTQPITRYKQSAVLLGSTLYTFGGESYQPYMYHNSIETLQLALHAADADSRPAEEKVSPSALVLVVAVVLFGALRLCSWCCSYRRRSAPSMQSTPKQRAA